MDKYIYRAKLDRVIDGDTVDALIDVGFDIWVKKRIRYMGIDTWESRTRDLEEKAKGLKAKERNKENKRIQDEFQKTLKTVTGDDLENSQANVDALNADKIGKDGIISSLNSQIGELINFKNYIECLTLKKI